mmetsp:Transcript_80624/g.261295  ORF Transcript_80624/g.261295 Transcript_80624/m.261295 type:complete len:330 (-) Transcript_80624:231-1220(-)
MLDRAAARRDVRDHHRAAVAADEGVLEDLRELGAAEGRVVELLVQRADALLQGQQGLVDLRAVHARLAVRVERVGPALAAGQVDEGDLAVLQWGPPAVLALVPRVLEADLQDRVGPRGVHVRARDARGAAVQPELDDLHELLHVLHGVLLQADDDDVGLGVLAGVQDLPVVQQVEELAAVDLVEGDVDAEVAVLLAAEAPEDVLRRQQEDAGRPILLGDALALLLVRPHHREGLSAASLPVREARALGTVKDGVDDRPDARAVELLIRDRLVEGLVEEEVVLLNVAREVDLELGLAHDHGTVPAEHHVLLLRLRLTAVHGSLPDHNAQP